MVITKDGDSIKGKGMDLDAELDGKGNDGDAAPTVGCDLRVRDKFLLVN